MPPTTLEPPTQTDPGTLADFDSHFNDLESAPAPEPAALSTPENVPPNETPEPEPTVPEPAPTPSPRQRDSETGQFTKPQTPTPTPKPAEAPKTVGQPDPKQTPATGEFDPPQVAKPSELRNWAKRMGTRAETAERQLVQINRRVKELESAPAQQQGDTKALTEEVARLRKQLDSSEGELKTTRYERSQEYKDKYETPYQNAVKNAYAETQELLVAVPNPDNPDSPGERQANTQDFDEVYNLPLGPATKLAKQKFGDAAGIVLSHVKAIKDARKAAVGAIQEHAGKAKEFEQQQVAQQRVQQEGRDRMFSDALTNLTEKYPDLFGQRDGDSKWNEAITKGKTMADLAFSDRKTLTPAQSVILDAQIHARVTGYGALKQAYDASKADVARLTKELEAIRSSAPGKTAGAAPSAGPVVAESWEKGFDEKVS